MIRRNGFQEYVIPMPTLALRFSAVKLLVDRSLINILRRLEGQGRESARIECDLPDFHQTLAPGLFLSWAVAQKRGTQGCAR